MNKIVLLLWTSAQRGLRGMRASLAKSLRAPHGLDAIELDLPGAISGRGTVPRPAGLAVDKELEAAILASLGWREVQAILEGRSPRVVVAIDPVAALVADTWRRKGLLDAPVVGVTCGLRLDPAWGAAAVDRLAVADEVMAKRGLGIELPPECLVPSGVPLCGGFSTPSPDEMEDHRRRLGLPLDRPILLVVTDGLEDQLDELVAQLSGASDGATILFDVETDDRAAEALRVLASRAAVSARMFGKVDEAGELWAASSLVLARPLLYIEQRILNLRLPLVCLPRAPVELEVADLYVERGIGLRVDDLSSLAAALDPLLEPDSLRGARHLMLGISRRRSAVKKVAQLIAQVHVEADVMLAERRARIERTASPVETAEVTETPRKQVVERIGPAKGK